MKNRLLTVCIIVLGIVFALFVYASEPKLRETGKIPFINTQSATSSALTKYPFKLGLDLAGGVRLVYKADLTNVVGSEADAMASLRDVIERRVNLFGVGEPVVQTEKSALSGEERLLVELPGISDIDMAIKMIGETPTLEFKTVRDEESKARIMEARTAFAAAQANGEQVTLTQELLEDPDFISTGLTGRYLKKSQVVFNEQNQPQVSLQFDEEGSKLFEDITRENIGKPVAIYLDGAPISIPNVNDVITGGQAVIQGDFTVQDAKQLVGRLNSGALPVPVTLIGTEHALPTLGEVAMQRGVAAALAGFLLVSIFLILWYRLPGLLAVIALSIYAAVMLSLFKFFGITLTAAGIAGFIISIGLAVDANVLIFERMKEEVRKGSNLYDAVETGFKRAWTSIRDSNTSSLLVSLVLFSFGTSIVKGFALTFGLGVLVSMLSAIVISRILLLTVVQNKKRTSKTLRFLFGSGITK